jgi:dihydrofolate synthase/folylpolyglutamate synthase
MNYTETIDYLYKRLPMFTRIGAAAYKKDLHNTLALLEVLDHPEKKIKSIHVAGTNGKGSTSHMLASILAMHGMKTGLYTSPHLFDFRERMRINGEWISEEFVVDFVKRIQPHLDAIEPSFFELTVAMAFEWFARQQVDVAIIETGLGGRLDSTNVITPELSVITNIGWDHMDLLGDTLEKIATEKAGIIKPGIPVVLGEKQPEADPVFIKRAAEMNAGIYWAEEVCKLEEMALHEFGMKARCTIVPTNTPLVVSTDLAGIYQQHNLKTALTATYVLMQQNWPLNWPETIRALTCVKTSTGLQGRWQVLRTQPAVVLDVAHNLPGVTQVLRHINHLIGMHPTMKIHFILGVVKDKDVGSILSILPAHFHYYFTQSSIPRALPARELQDFAKKFHLQGNRYAHANEALSDAMVRARAQDLIIVCGSVFLIAEVDIPAVEQRPLQQDATA